MVDMCSNIERDNLGDLFYDESDTVWVYVGEHKWIDTEFTDEECITTGSCPLCGNKTKDEE